MSSIWVHSDWRSQEQYRLRRRERTRWVLLGWTLVLLGCVWWVQHHVDRLVFKALLTDSISWGIATGLFVWYALRYHPARRSVACGYGLAVVIMFVLINSIVKWDLASWPPEAMDAPILFWGLWHWFYLGIIAQFALSYPQEARALGLHFNHWPRDIGVGLLGGGVLAGHYLFALTFTGASQVRVFPLPFLVWEASFQVFMTLATELFYRATLYRYLESERHWDFWAAAAVVAAVGVALYLVKARWTSDIITIVGVIFYVIILNVINSALYRWTRSLLPGYIAGLVFHITAMLR
ncbi:MAG TPA: hypothetical protein PKH77_08940 [Anaerolineae bacterium]|nr:hypothetical protein [Anaerolineae bacterium]